MEFDNGFSASIVTRYLFCDQKDVPYELAVIHGGKLHYDNPAADGDVLGDRTREEVEDLLRRVKELEPLEKLDAGEN